MFNVTSVEHLNRTCSDHSPLLLSISNEAPAHKSSFRFLNILAAHDSFSDVVRKACDCQVSGKHSYIFSQKLKATKRALLDWNKATFGNVFQNRKQAEDEVLEKELLFELNNSSDNRAALHLAQAKLKASLKKEEDFWKQKSHLKWIKDGNGNTKLFHASVQQARRKLHLHSIRNMHGGIISTESEIKATTVEYYTSQLQDSAAGSDGFSGKFYTSCWDIICSDLLFAILEFFAGFTLPRSWTSTLIVTIPKTEQVDSFKDLRPISLCIFCNKIITKILTSHLSKVLPLIIFKNQRAFTKGRLIQDNMLLAHEMLSHLRKKISGSNILMKLDMEKAFDHVSWQFLIKVLHKFGFGETFINMIWRIVSSNWFSVLINGEACGFFASSRGLRQGDPISPSLFIIAAEVLSRGLNDLQLNHPHTAYSSSIGCPIISHLSFANDIMIFCNESGSSLDLHKNLLANYESCSGQLINREKSCFMASSRLPPDRINAIV